MWPGAAVAVVGVAYEFSTICGRTRRYERIQQPQLLGVMARHVLLGGD